jgi:hypothetical protein
MKWTKDDEARFISNDWDQILATKSVRPQLAVTKKHISMFVHLFVSS